MLRGIMIALFGLLLIGIFFTLYYARAVLCPIMLAVVLNFVLSPFVRFLRRIGVPNFFGAIIVLAVTLAVVSIGTIQLIQPASRWMREAPQVMEELEQKLKFLRRPVERISEASEKLEKVAAAESESADDETVDVRMVAPSMSATVLSVTGTAVIEICITLILLFFLLAAGSHFLNKLVEAVPQFHNKKTVVEIVRDVEHGISHYLMSITVINVLLGVAIGIAMWLLDMPNPILWGVMGALLNYVPYLGPIVGTTVIALVSLATFDNTGYALLVPAVFYLLTAVEGSFITPSVLGLRLDLNPVIIFSWMLIWAWLWGIAGALLAVPILAIIKITCDHIEPLRGVSAFIGK